MTLNEEVVQFLVDEAIDCFPAGEVGLYEFMWSLNSSRFELSREDRIVHARAALDRLLAEEDVSLIWTAWGDWSSEKDAELSALEDVGVWDDITDAPYLAVIPTAELLARRQPQPSLRSRLKRRLGRAEIQL